MVSDRFTALGRDASSQPALAVELLELIQFKIGCNQR
jgi:hypothetical protein